MSLLVLLVKQKARNASQVLGQIRKLIEGGGLDPDGKLPTERELSTRLNVGRRELRRALDALEAEGLIWRRQGKGTFIGLPPDPKGKLAAEIIAGADPLSVMEARLCIEPELAALCAGRAVPEDVARMHLLVDRIDQSSDADSAELWDGSLHRLIARVAANPILLTAFALLDEVRASQDWQDQRDLARSADTRRLYTQQHMAIVDAISRKDAGAARHRMHDHLSHLSRNLQAVHDRAAP